MFLHDSSPKFVLSLGFSHLFGSFIWNPSTTLLSRLLQISLPSTTIICTIKLKNINIYLINLYLLLLLLLQTLTFTCHRTVETCQYIAQKFPQIHRLSLHKNTYTFLLSFFQFHLLIQSLAKNVCLKVDAYLLLLQNLNNIHLVLLDFFPLKPTGYSLQFHLRCHPRQSSPFPNFIFHFGSRYKIIHSIVKISHALQNNFVMLQKNYIYNFRKMK